MIEAAAAFGSAGAGWPRLPRRGIFDPMQAPARCPTEEATCARGSGHAEPAPDLIAPDLIAPDLIAPDLIAPDLIAENLSCRRGARLVFAGLSFRLAAGGALVLTGANGSGKTSLLRLVAALTAPAAGRLLWGAQPIAADLAAHRARLHFVGHQDAVKPALTPRETLAFWAALRGLAGPRCAPVLDAALAAFALDGVADWPCRWLSAGQRRRLALCRLLVSPAPLWLLDEPTSALDDDGRGRLEQAIAVHRGEGGRVLLSTHVPVALDAAATLVLDAFAAPAAAPADGDYGLG